MPSREGSNLRPLWRFRHALNKQKVKRGAGNKERYYYVRSPNVYENKQSYDKMPGEKPDIYGKLTRILQRIADSDGQFAANGVFGTCFVRKFTVTVGLRTASMQETPHPLRTSAPSPRGEGGMLNHPLRGERVAAMRRRVRGHFVSDKPLGGGSASLLYTVRHAIAQSTNWGSAHDSIGKSHNR